MPIARPDSGTGSSAGTSAEASWKGSTTACSTLGDGQGGAIYPAQEGQSPGAPIVYFDTEDIEASIAKVRELGGTADDKQPVPTHGWFAGCKDTEGNAFSLWQND